MPMPTATSATAIEVRAPTMIIEKHVAAEMVGAEPVRAPRAAGACAAMSMRREVVGRPDERDERRRATTRSARAAMRARRGRCRERRASAQRRRSRGSTSA